tara:strand:- start:582 stop:3398 length:2817 start_codon:yes stop_codon:yes gene_type:complete
MKSLGLYLLTATLFTLPLQAQFIKPAATTTAHLMNSLKERSYHRTQSLLNSYPIRNVGPVTMSGRVSDIAVHPDTSRIFYVGFGSAGIFKTTNGGTTMKPVFDNQGGAIGIGDIAISKSNPNILWAGTGEKNSSRSTYAGTGVYKTIDSGKTWNHMGLEGTHHIGRILVHPNNPEIVWVGSMGALYSENSDRGVYKTVDGGQTWEKTLFVNEGTGVIDLIINPKNPKLLWAATWERSREAWNFVESGEGSAVYHSKDGGNTWEKVNNGLPTGRTLGRIGLSISAENPNRIYALIDNQDVRRVESENQANDGLKSDALWNMNSKDFLSLENEEINQFLRQHGFPSKYTAEIVKKDISANIYPPSALADYIGDANAELFDTKIIGAEVYKTDNGGQSWEKTHQIALDNVYFTYGYYFGEIRVDPSDANTLYIMGVPILKSNDAGRNWRPIAENQRIHVDHQTLWINPNDGEHLLLGNDGGLYESKDGGENFIHHNVAPVGQFYTVNVDMDTPYNIYGGLQDNGTWRGSSRSTPDREQPWERLYGGDGMHVNPHPENSNIIYVGFQYGNYMRRDLDSGASYRITPRHEVGEDRYRYNWNTPVELSHHNSDIIYFGSQRLNRSFDEGKKWTTISPDLSYNLPNGDVPYSTLTTISESPLSFDIIWTGTDDGKVHRTTDAGATWVDVSNGLPAYRWISELHASSHNSETAYVSLNGYRFDEFVTYVYKTIDLGKTWTSVKGNLPDDVVNIIVQDPVKPEILYAGLDHGSYVSFDDGQEWHLLNNIPNVASYDMVVHPRDFELVVATHGRSIYVLDTTPFHELVDRLNESITLFRLDDILYSNRWGTQSVDYRNLLEPNFEALFFVQEPSMKKSNQPPVKYEIEIEIKKDELILYSTILDAEKGFNTFNWNLWNPTSNSYLTKGTYIIQITNGSTTHAQSFEIK